MKYQWHVFLASLDPTKGSEQAGKRPLDRTRLERDLGEVVEANVRQEILAAIRFQLEL